METIIDSYKRAQALEDGVLIDISNMAREAGFTIPVAVTNAVWSDYIQWSNKDTEQQTYQDTNGRLWDVLSMLRFAINKHTNSDCIFYKLSVVPRNGQSKTAKTIQLKAII
ncbi:MAG: DUF6573 family protein, partial [Gammaproteobacteria bacterium]